MNTLYGYAKNSFLPIYTLCARVTYFAKKANSSRRHPLPSQVYKGQAGVRTGLLHTSCFLEGFQDRDNACFWILTTY